MGFARGGACSITRVPGDSKEGEAMIETRMKILEVIAANSGQYSWYQIDRRLSEFGVEHWERPV